MGNACHCVNEKDGGNTMDLGKRAQEHKLKGDVRDDESNVGDDAMEKEFPSNDPELNNAATKLQV